MEIETALLENNFNYKMVYQESIEATPKQSFLEIFPLNKDETIKIVKILFEYDLQYEVVSTGCNWGLGSRWSESGIVLNLQNLNSISLNEDFGVAIIDTGVTQGQLVDCLKKSGSKYYLDVTGSSRYSGILSNALERGIAYNSQRVVSIINMEVLLRNGKIINTSIGDSYSKLKNLYPFPTGADLKGIFFQSEFGIVLSASIELRKKSRYYSQIQLKFHDQKSLLNSISVIRELIEDNVITGIPHIANKERTWSSIIPAVSRQLGYSNKGLTKSELKLLKFLIGEFEWTGIITIKGDKGDVKRKLKILKRAMKKYCSISIKSKNSINLLSYLVTRIDCKLFNIAKVLLEFYKYSLGESSDQAVIGITSQPINELTRSSIIDAISKSNSGYLYSLPICENSKKKVAEMLNIINEISNRFSYHPAITLNPISKNVMEAVISISFDKKKSDFAHEYIDKLKDSFRKKDIYLYRLSKFDKELKEINTRNLDLLNTIVKSNQQKTQ